MNRHAYKKLRLKFRLVLMVIGAGFVVYQQWLQESSPVSATHTSELDAVYQAYQRRAEDVQVSGQGEIVHILPDDNTGSRHQKLLVRMPQGFTVLIAHNIDLAPRVSGVKKGDAIAFSGEYIWNEKGGVVHWTHHDPRGQHPGGWLEHQGRRYE